MAWEANYGLQQSMAQYVEGRTTIDTTKTEWKCGGCGISAGYIHALMNKDWPLEKDPKVEGVS